MATSPNEPPAPPQVQMKLSPAQIADMANAAAALKSVPNTMQHVGNERSGQLSPSHTPGR
jgi:hypothetical protein